MVVKDTAVATGKLSRTNREIQQSLLGNNDFESGLTYTDAGGGSTLSGMLVLGQVAATKKILPIAPAGSDGSEQFFGFLHLGLGDSIVVGDAESRTGLTVVIKGRIDINSIVFPAGVTLDTVIGTKTLRQIINDRGFVLVDQVDNTSYTNS